MKTKLLCFSIVLYAWGILNTSAQLICCTNCTNFTAVITNKLCAGFNLIANPFCALNDFGVVDQNINNVLRFVPDGSSLFKWDGAGGHYLPPDVFFAGPDRWFDGSLMVSTTTLNLFEGAFIEVPYAFDLFMFGCVPPARICPAPPLPCGWSIRSCPLGMTFSSCIPAPSDGDTIFFWDCANQRWADSLVYFAVFGTWFDSAFNPVIPSPAVGEAFFYYHTCP